MAVLALAGVGAAIAAGGAAAAGITGTAILTAASIGFSAGAIAGQILFPQRIAPQNQEGARLGDLTVTTSTYGVVVPIAFGDVRITGNVIWALPIREQKTVTTQGGGKGGKGGKGGGSSTVTTYTYFATFALALCEGPVGKVLRIWANSTLIYDQSSGANVSQKEGVNFRFYPGNDSQLPDSLIEADKGAGNVPAFRGTAYFVFEDLLLTDYGNRIPNITAELAFDTTPDQTPIPLSPTTPAILGHYSPAAIAVNPFTLHTYIWGTVPTGIVDINTTTMSVVGEHKLGDITGDPADNSIGVDHTSVLSLGADGALYALDGYRVLQIDVNTWKLKNTYTINGGIPTAIATLMAPVGLIDQDGNVQSFMMLAAGNLGGFTHTDAIEVYDTKANARAGGFGAAGGASFFAGGVKALCFGKVALMHGDGYVLSVGSATPADQHIFLQRLTISIYADIGLLGVEFKRKLDVQTVFEATCADFEPTADGWYSSGTSTLTYDETDDGVILQVITIIGFFTQNVWLFKWSNNGGLVWAKAFPMLSSAPIETGTVNSKITGGRYSLFQGHHLVTIDTATGEILNDDTWTIFPLGPQIYDSDANAMIVALGASTWSRINVDRVSSAPASLSEIFGSICEKAALVDGTDFDVSALDAVSVPGYTVSQRAYASEILRPLAQLFLVDAVESDGKIVFQLRGGSEVAAITEDEFVRASTSDNAPDPYTETRLQEIDLPGRVTISYVDQDADYQVNTQYAQRVRLPRPTVFSDQQVDLQIAVVFTATEARQRAEILLYTAWLERHQIAAMLPPKYVWLNAADPVGLTFDDGYTLRARLGQTDLGVDGTTQTTMVGENDGQYVSTITAPDGAPGFPQTIELDLPSALFLLDVPNLRDIDDAGDAGIRAYWAASSYGVGTWRGAKLEASQDRTLFIGVGITLNPASWGHLETALPDAISTFSIRREQSVVVQMQVGGDDLASCTFAQILNGSNGAAVFKGNGEIEVIQYRDVVALGSGRYQLSVLARGRRGTDTMAGGHVAGETIVFLIPADIEPTLLPLSMLNKIGYYRAVTAGTLPAGALIEGQKFEGRDKMPWAPVNVSAALSGSDIAIAWNRRARVNGGLHDGDANVPWAETIASFQVDIYNAGGDTVLRTLNSATEGVTYAAADITTDFGTAPASLNLRVVQLSATVGRGFSRLDHVEVA